MKSLIERAFEWVQARLGYSPTVDVEDAQRRLDSALGEAARLHASEQRMFGQVVELSGELLEVREALFSERRESAGHARVVGRLLDDMVTR